MRALPRRRKDPERTRQNAAELLALLLQDRLRCTRGGTYDGVHERHLRELCSGLLWKHSEALGKYAGCEHWSVGAEESRRTHRKCVTGTSAGGGALRHEHLTLRKQMIDLLFALADPTKETIGRELEARNIGVVVTVDEHRLLGPGTLDDPWRRYEISGVRLATGSASAMSRLGGPAARTA